eukprot:CAMPEP_0174266764 /NCGR_PEP_ID=MMETSP0439-20130205/31326_1 /TAXON_ID=0 /ORGANISM="Stereomyxa ramosa, Strain Chinc5" /LENGTH=794 /DNA_ID=CAMNT_0015353907 /DNA_START=93 /DNA_END=2474 /DNA_ORIENTATION=-
MISREQFTASAGTTATYGNDARRRGKLSHSGIAPSTTSISRASMQLINGKWGKAETERKQRTLSVDTGLERMVKTFYEQKLAETKKQTDLELTSFIERIEAMITKYKWTAGKLQVLQHLKATAQTIRSARPQDMINGNCKTVVRQTFELILQTKLKKDERLKVLMAKLLWILSTCTRLAEYVDSKDEEFIGWAVENFRSGGYMGKAAQRKNTGPKVQIMESTIGGDYVVCRICEGVVPEDTIDSHTDLCSVVAANQGKFWNCNNNMMRVTSVLKGELQPEPDDSAVPGEGKKSKKEKFPLLKNLGKRRDSSLDLDKIIDSDSAMSPDDIISSVTGALDGISSLEAHDRNTVTDLEKRIKTLNTVAQKIETASGPNHPALTPIRAIIELCNEKVRTSSVVIETIQKITNTNVFDSNFHNVRPRDNDDNDQEDSPPKKNKKHRPSIKDFEIVKPISSGSFGSVVLAQKKATKDFYAIKVLKKCSVNNKNLEHIRNERNILAFTNNPWVVKLYYSFQSKNNLYLVMEYLPGGDCFSLMRNLVAFPEKMTRQYIAETVLALDYLHKNGIVHRDLKPDNMLITKDGHIKLTDFGLSKMGAMDKQEEIFNWSKRSGQDLMESEGEDDAGTVGTPDYIAPEIFLSTGHGPPVDWWALGCICYEFLVGMTPFYGETCEEIFENIINYNILWPEPPDEISTSARDLITQLLMMDPAQRLGSGSVEDLTSHPFFSEIDWDNLLEQKGFFVPRVKSSDDTSYFDARNDIGYATTWEDDVDQGGSEIEFSGRYRNFSFVGIENLSE